jgi:hypothetical protein
MTAKITFTQAEQTAIETAIKCLPVLRDAGATSKNLNKLLEKMVAAREKEETKFTGVSVAKVHSLARDKWGDRYKTPPMITKEWTIKMQRALTSSGIDEATATKAIDNCDWAGDIWSETLIYQMSKLSVMGTYKPAQKSFGFTPTPKSGWLGMLEDSE